MEERVRVLEAIATNNARALDRQITVNENLIKRLLELQSKIIMLEHKLKPSEAVRERHEADYDRSDRSRWMCYKCGEKYGSCACRPNNPPCMCLGNPCICDK